MSCIGSFSLRDWGGEGRRGREGGKGGGIKGSVTRDTLGEKSLVLVVVVVVGNSSRGSL